MKTALRPLSFVLSFVLIFSFFLVPVSAENISSGPHLFYDLEDWVRTNPDYTSITGKSTGNSGILAGYPVVYDITLLPMPVGDSSLGLRTGIFYDVSGLVAGDSYSFYFSLFSPSQYNNFFSDSNLTDSYYDFFTKRNAVLYVGLGSVSSSGDFTISGDIGVVIDKNNYNEYFGKDNKLTFVLPNIVNPAVGIFYMDTTESGNSTHLYFSNMYLINNTDEEEEETKGLLNSIISAIRDLGDFITDGFTDISDGISDLGTSITDGLGNLEFNLLSGFEDLLKSFANLFLYLNWDPDPPDNPFESSGGPLDIVESFFDDLFNYLEDLKSDLVSVVDSVSSGVFVFETMVDRFPWIKGLCVFSLALIVVTRFIGL